MSCISPHRPCNISSPPLPSLSKEVRYYFEKELWKVRKRVRGEEERRGELSSRSDLWCHLYLLSRLTTGSDWPSRRDLVCHRVWGSTAWVAGQRCHRETGLTRVYDCKREGGGWGILFLKFTIHCQVFVLPGKVWTSKWTRLRGIFTSLTFRHPLSHPPPLPLPLIYWKNNCAIFIGSKETVNGYEKTRSYLQIFQWSDKNGCLTSSSGQRVGGLWLISKRFFSNERAPVFSRKWIAWVLVWLAPR